LITWHVHRAGDWFGATVNLAARVSGLADGGEALLTDTTREGAGDIDGVRFEAHGVHRLRNVTPTRHRHRPPDLMAAHHTDVAAAPATQSRRLPLCTLIGARTA
jgi:class 3 adenylate cyclase